MTAIALIALIALIAKTGKTGKTRNVDKLERESVRSTNPKWLEFDIHGVASVRVASDAPTAQQLEMMFEPFRASGLEQFDLEVTGAFEPQEDFAYAEDAYHYSDSVLYLTGPKVQIVVEGKSFRLHGKRELLTCALPLIDRILVERGVAMIHAATFEYRGHGVVMPAWGGTGKTSTIAKLTRNDDFGFMGDDWAFVGASGELLGYAKPMFIKPHHNNLFPHLFTGRRKPLVPKVLSRHLSRLATAVHGFITQYPRLAAFFRRWSPEYMLVTPREALPDARITSTAPLALIVFVERGESSETVLRECSKAEMVARMVGNFHAELGRQSQELITALAATGLVPIEQTFAEKAAVLDQALEGKPLFILRVPRSLGADEASDAIVAQLHNAFAAAGIEPRSA